MSEKIDKPTDERAAKAVDLPKTGELVSFKALGDGAAPGSFEAVVAVYGNIDSHGDRILPGFFDDSLKAPKDGGRGLPPIVWTHDWQTPPIGVTMTADPSATVTTARGTITGLKLVGRFLVADDEDHATARAVWASMKTLAGDGLPPLREWSFGYRTKQAQWVQEDVDTLPAELQWTGGEIRELVKGLLFEAGPTLVGSNAATETLAVKSAVRRLEVSGAITSDEAKTMLREVGDTPDPTSPAPMPRKQLEATDEVKARIAELEQFRPPESI